MLRAALALLSLAPVGLRAAADPELHELIDRANKALRGDSSRGHLTMTIVTPSWRREIEVEGWNKDRQYAFIRILGPAKDKGNVTLRRKSEMWLWLAKVERVVKIPPTMMHSAWQGSDFTYEDIVKADSIVRDYEHALLSKKAQAGRVVYEVRADPKPDAPVVWGRVVIQFGLYKDGSVLPEREEDYSERGELIRTITFSDVKTLGGRLLPARMECVPARKTGQKTVVQYQSLDFDVPITEDFFTLARLQKGGA